MSNQIKRVIFDPRKRNMLRVQINGVPQVGKGGTCYQSWCTFISLATRWKRRDGGSWSSRQLRFSET